jgi:SAM-dependent methyltransferase
MKTNRSDDYAKDFQATLRNRARLAANRNLLFWYQELYKDQFRNLGNLKGLAILEIGSGVSPLARFCPSVQTSDVLELDYVDLVFDCQRIDEFEPISDNSLDVITLTNVLHHLKSPIDFLVKAAKKLKPGGALVATEPYFSVVSTFIYKYLHHEPVDFSIEAPELTEVRDPLSSANQALPWLIFNRPKWRRQIEQHFYLESPVFRPYTGLSYFATGGISHRIPMPHLIYRCLFAADVWLSRVAPKLMASFFTITLFRKERPCASRT